MEKGELQVAGKERESQLSSQFRDIATIVMQKTINPETQRPYTISMIERLMHEIHFAVDPHSSSKKQVMIGFLQSYDNFGQECIMLRSPLCYYILHLFYLFPVFITFFYFNFISFLPKPCE